MRNRRPGKQRTMNRRNEGFSATLWITAEGEACISGSEFFQPSNSWGNAVSCVKFVLIFSQEIWLRFPGGKRAARLWIYVFFFFFVFPHFGDLKSVSFQSARELTAHSQISLQGELSTEKSDKKGDPGVLSVDKFWPCLSQDVKFNCFCQPLNIPFSLSSFQPNFRFLLEEESIPELHFSML